jgi:hypothetical protein
MDPRGKFVRAFDPDTSSEQIAAALHALIAHRVGVIMNCGGYEL